ncbi:phosphoglycerate kinase [Candidatus Pacearchaeota archaeon]|nr:phosphoglycerate kinase [Candidatus Pacearchaeota archaeon]
MKTLSNFNFKNKTVLLRTDLNSDIVNKKLLPSERIKQAAATIKELKKKKAKIIILAHQGRPGKSDLISLKQHANQLNKYTKVKFIPDTLGKKARQAIQSLKSGQAILLENIRFQKDEFKPEKNKNNKIIQTLTPLSDIYVNDAFSICHRNQTSIVSFPKYLPSCAGRLLEQEINALKKIKLKSCLFILGGAKPEDNIKLFKNNKILACGLFGQLCLIVKGKNLGVQNKYIQKNLKPGSKLKKELKTRIKKLASKLSTPIDFALKIKNKRKEIPLEQFPSKYEIFDIGSATIEKYTQEIKKAKAIFMKGPAGFCADTKFCKGTKAILKAIAKNKGFSVLGGGHLNDALRHCSINKKKFNHISLSGGALARYIAGERLPGLEALK